MTSNQAHISILIPTRNNENDLIDCLKSVGRLDYPPEKIKIIIWDNNSQPESRNAVKDYLAQMPPIYSSLVEFIENSENYGVYTSRDELCKRVTSDTQFVLSIDDDVILPPNLLNELIHNFQHDSSIGIIG